MAGSILTASTFNQLGQYTSSPGCWGYCFAELAVFSSAPQTQLWCWHCAPYKCSYYYYYYYSLALAALIKTNTLPLQQTARKGIWSVKSWMLFCSWWWFFWSFTCLIVPIVTIISIMLRSSKNSVWRYSDTAYQGCPGKWPLNMSCCGYCR